MPNWCSTTYAVQGDKVQLMKFCLDMGIASQTDSGSDWREAWLGNIYLQAGYTEKDISESGWIECRGSVNSIGVDGDGDEIRQVTLWCETAWQPMFDSFLRMLEEKYPGLKGYCIAEEPGCGIYFNSDETYTVFTDRYMVDNMDDTEYFGNGDEEGMLKYLEELTGIKCKSAKEALKREEELEQAYREKEGNEDFSLRINEFTAY